MGQISMVHLLYVTVLSVRILIIRYRCPSVPNDPYLVLLRLDYSFPNGCVVNQNTNISPHTGPLNSYTSSSPVEKDEFWGG